MNTENRISAILKERGFKHVQPTDELLETLNCTSRRFFKIIDGKVELTLTEGQAFANWLNVSVEELSPSNNEPPLTNRHLLSNL